MTPLLSIIIPDFSSHEYLYECVRSIAAQRYRELEVVVVDDGSPMPVSPEKIAGLLPEIPTGRLKVIRTEHCGAAAARNVGRAAAGGDYVMLLDSDDRLADNIVRGVMQRIAADDADVLFAGWMNFSTEHASEVVSARGAPNDDIYEFVVERMPVTGSVVLKKSLDAEINERQMPWEMLEYYMDAALQCRKAIFFDQTMVRIRQSSNQSRLTIKHDHFNSKNTAAFFCRKKRELILRGQATIGRIGRLDHKILSNCAQMMKNGLIDEAEFLLQDISWEHIARHQWCHALSVGWFMRMFGVRGGGSIFFNLNAMMRRA